MSNSVLVFEENKAIQGLIASTISDQVELWQESRPDAFLQLADRYSPSLIFISNADQQQDYALCRQLQQHSSLSQVPKVLLVNARDDVNESLLEQFGLQGMIRKPFEAATLQEHIQRYLPSVELQSEPMDSAEEVNVFDDEMLGLIQDNGESVDETLFDRKRMGPRWKSSYRYECPPLSGIATNQNRANGGSNVSSPAIAAGQRMVAALRRAGVRVTGGVRAGRDVPGGDVIGQVRSERLERVLDFMNAHSDNFTAETLTKDVGAYVAGRGTTAAGTREAEDLLRGRGILTASDDFVDGSGLSHSNRVSASTLVGVLRDAEADPSWGDALVGSLPRGGEGTLRRRLKGPAVRKRVRAKTGYINGVASLAGTVTSRSGARYAFAFLMNTSDISGAQKAMDRAVTLLATGRADGVPG